MHSPASPGNDEVLDLKKIRKSTVIAGLFILLVSHPSYSEQKPIQADNEWLYAFRGGILAHDVTLWSRSRAEGGVDFNAEVGFKFPDYDILKGKLNSNLGVSLNHQGDTSKAYGGLFWEHVWKSGMFFNFGLGLAVHNGQLESDDRNVKELGSRFLFRIPIEIGVYVTRHHGMSIMFDHVSNGYLASPNEGLDTIGLRYSYRF
jgi:hypothetical protein